MAVPWRSLLALPTLASGLLAPAPLGQSILHASDGHSPGGIFGLAAAQDQEPPTASRGRGAASQDPPAFSDEQIVETLAMVRDALELCAEAQVKGDLDEARLHAGGALEVLQTLGELSDAQLLASLEAIADRANELGLLRAQLAAKEWIVRIRERLLPADHPDLLVAKHNLAMTLFSLGDVEGARELEEHVIAARERLLPADHPDLLATKTNMAITLSALGDLEGARELFEHVHAARERLLPRGHLDLLTAKGNLGISRYVLGDLDGALELQEHVHASLERLLPADHHEFLLAKVNLAITLSALGDLEGTRELEEYVHTARERLLPADHPDLLKAKSNLAVTRQALGDLEGACELEEYVHAAWVRLLPADHRDLLMAKNNLASSRQALGDLEGARELEEYVHAAWVRLLPADNPDLLLAKSNLAISLYSLGDLEGARELEEHLHAARERLLPADHPDLLRTMGNLAITRRALGDLEGARELLERVHAAWERLLPADHPDLLLAELHMAITRSALGDLEAARELLERVHAAWERLLPAGHPDLLKTMLNLASTRRALGDLEGARAMTRSLLAGQLVRTAGLCDESPRVARSAALRELQRLSEALFCVESAAIDPGESLDGSLFSVLESLRSVSTSSSEVALAAARHPELAGLRSRVAQARAELNDFGTSPPADRKDLESWRKDLVKLADERDGLQRRLRSALAAKGVFTETITSESVAKALGSDSLAIGFFRYPRRSEKDPDTGEVPPTVDSLLAFVVTPDAAVQRVELGAISELEELATRWRAALGKPVQRGVRVQGSAAEEETEEAAGRLLRERLLDPCLAVLGADPPQSIHIVLDDFLHLFPVDALPWNDGRRVGEVIEVHVEVSMRRLVAPPEVATVRGVLVALGGADFGAQGIMAPSLRLTTATPPTGDMGKRAGAPGRFDSLLQTRIEVEALGILYREFIGEEPTVLLAKDASKRALVELAGTARYLHVATHGWFAPETFQSMRESAEEEGGDEATIGLERAQETLRGFAPETLCGLALAGANHGRNALGKVPGILTAEELATLDLANCELAVLSACETNVGLRRAGQGIQSLQGALHSAGARTAITSLWKVDDALTRRLMELFYTNLWGEGLGKADALWQAKMALRTEGHPVQDWAAWVLTGDPR